MKKLFATLFCIALLSACTNSESETDKQVSLLNGTPASLDQYINGKQSVLNFWAASCAFCRHELPYFDASYDAFDDLVVVGINMQEPQSIAQEYWIEGGYKFPSLLDPSNELRQKYKASIQPTTVFLNEQGEVVYRKDGPLSEDEYYEQLQLHFGLQKDSEPESEEQKPKDDIEVLQNQPDSNIEKQRSKKSIVLSDWYEDYVDHLIPIESILSGGPDKDGIPSIDDPSFLPIKDSTHMSDNDIGILLTINGDTRFYPYKILNWHEIVNDTVGEEPIFVTYCPLCATGVVYSRVISEGIVEFGVSGLLAQSNLLMYDRASESLWNQVTGQAVVGPLTGEYLTFVRSDIVSYAVVKNTHPTAKILSTDTGFVRNYNRDPYSGYADKDEIIFPTNSFDDRLTSKEIVYGITVNGIAKAYRPDDIVTDSPITDIIGGQEILITFNEGTKAIEFTTTDGLVLPSIPSFWFAWVAQHADTQLYE